MNLYKMCLFSFLYVSGNHLLFVLSSVPVYTLRPPNLCRTLWVEWRLVCDITETTKCCCQLIITCNDSLENLLGHFNYYKNFHHQSKFVLAFSCMKSVRRDHPCTLWCTEMVPTNSGSSFSHYRKPHDGANRPSKLGAPLVIQEHNHLRTSTKRQQGIPTMLKEEERICVWWK